MGGVSLITADHGNAERMLDADGTTPTPPTPPTWCPSILWRRCQAAGRPPGRHRPTMLDLMGLEKPAEMDGETLILN